MLLLSASEKIESNLNNFVSVLQETRDRMQVKKASNTGLLAFRANRQLVQSNRQATKDGQQVQTNKELVKAASKIQVTRKPEVKPGHVPVQERIPTSPTPEEQAAMVFNVSYLEQQQRNGGGEVKKKCTIWTRVMTIVEFIL